MHAVARLYKEMICQVRMGEGTSDTLSCHIRVKQGYPLSPTLFGLCIPCLKQMVQNDALQERNKEGQVGNVVIMVQIYVDEDALQEGNKEGLIGNVVIMVQIYVDDVVLFIYTLDDAQKMIVVLKTVFSHYGLTINDE